MLGEGLEEREQSKESGEGRERSHARQRVQLPDPRVWDPEYGCLPG